MKLCPRIVQTILLGILLSLPTSLFADPNRSRVCNLLLTRENDTIHYSAPEVWAELLQQFSNHPPSRWPKNSNPISLAEILGSPRADGRYRVSSMRTRYEGEELPVGDLRRHDLFGRTQVRYLQPVEADRFRLRYRNGLIVNQYGEPRTIEHGLFVMDRDGNIFAGTVDHHSSFLRGNDVAAAGTITVHEGTIQSLSNSSGHYPQPPNFLNQVIHRLVSERITLHATGIYTRNENENTIFTWGFNGYRIPPTTTMINGLAQ